MSRLVRGVRWLLAIALAVGLFGLPALGAEASSPRTVYSYDDRPSTATPSVDLLIVARAYDESRQLSRSRTCASALRGYDERAHLSWPRLRTPGGVLATKGAEDVLRLPASESFGNAAKLEDHFVRHGADFGATSAEDYAGRASEFLQRSQRGGLPTKIDEEGVIRAYDPKTNSFGAYNANGTTRTFFKPRSPTYFQRQPGSPTRP